MIPSDDSIIADFADEARKEPDFSERVWKELNAIGNMLIEKNRAYGNSALEPIRVFSRAPRTEQLNVRIDDKLSRLMRGQGDGEDSVLDLIGYLVLLRVAQKGEAEVDG